MRDRSYRRHHDKRVKRNARRHFETVMRWKEYDHRNVGKAATQHHTCPCWMCTLGKHDGDMAHSDKRREVSAIGEPEA